MKDIRAELVKTIGKYNTADGLWEIEECTDQILELFKEIVPPEREPKLTAFEATPQHQKVEARYNTAYNECVADILSRLK